MNVSEIKISDNWQEVKDSCMTTINKAYGKYPNNSWKKNILLCEHSPIRRIKIYWKWIGLKYWVSVHFVRHKHGIEHWVSTQRPDKTDSQDKDRDKFLQGALVNHACEANAQALINISRKRLCGCASAQTQLAWKAVKEKIAELEPELASCMVRECIYRGFCPELHSCGYCDTQEYEKELKGYREV